LLVGYVVILTHNLTMRQAKAMKLLRN